MAGGRGARVCWVLAAMSRVPIAAPTCDYVTRLLKVGKARLTIELGNTVGGLRYYRRLHQGASPSQY
jgi:hypothetical protein